jgi:hypothetical protein
VHEAIDIFLTSASDKRLTSHYDRFNPGRVCGTHYTEGCGLQRCSRNFAGKLLAPAENRTTIPWSFNPSWFITSTELSAYLAWKREEERKKERKKEKQIKEGTIKGKDKGC